MSGANFRRMWIGSLLVVAIAAFGYGWEHRAGNPPLIVIGKSSVAPELKLVEKGRYDDAVRAVLDTIHDEKKDHAQYEIVATIYALRAAKEPANREKWNKQAAFYIEKQVSLGGDDALNLIVAAHDSEAIGDNSSDSCFYYGNAKRYAQGALDALQGDSIWVHDEKMPAKPLRDGVGQILKSIQDKMETKKCGTAQP